MNKQLYPNEAREISSLRNPINAILTPCFQHDATNEHYPHSCARAVERLRLYHHYILFFE